MCGIAGFIRAEPAAQEGDRQTLRAMAAAIAHRGPDDEDVWTGPGVGFAHRRLAVIDPHPHGRQPMTRGALTITYNGEIYNYRELRAELAGAGERFSTETDTEVLLAAWSRWGDRTLDRLNGMFAFALWDAGRKTLTLARDRIGKKPLYYTALPQEFVFGSEIKAVLASPSVPRRPDYEAIHHYLALQYVPAPFTAFADVRRLPAGALLEIQQGGEAVVRRYWSPPPPACASAQSDAELTEAIVGTLCASVKRRMVADVPVGAFLSGGIDSSAVVSFMAEEQSAAVKTFSIGFEDAAFDERRYARLVADRWKTDHYEDIVRPEATAILPEIVWHYGEPFADPSAIPTFYVSRLARRHVTVALSGDGGDEFFLGYSRYADCAALGWVDALPKLARGAAAAAARAIPAALAGQRPFGGIRRRLQTISASRSGRYEPAVMYFLETDKAANYGPALRPYLEKSTPDLLAPYFSAAPDMVAGASYADMHTYLPDDILVKVDVASMAHGLEARAPFLDVEMMELAASIPAERRMRGGQLKGLLKQALRERLPDEILDRPKMGFGVPIEKWFREDLRALAADTFLSQSARTRGLFKPNYELQLLDDHVAGRRLNHTRLWALLMLELWFRDWIDRAPAAPRKNAA